MPTEPPTGNQPTPTPPAIDWNQMVPVKVDGVEQVKTLREVVNGFATQASMHEARKEAKDLKIELDRYQQTMASMDEDPAAFIEKIKGHYNLSPESTGGDGPEINPALAEIAKLRADMERLAGHSATQEQITAQERQLASLASEEGFDRDKVIAYATANGVDNLQHAFLMYKGEHGIGQTQAPPSTPHQDLLNSLAARKAASLGAVAPGASPAAGAVVETPPGPPANVAQAIQRALDAKGTNMDGLMESITQ